MLRLSLVGALLGMASSAWAGPVPLTGDALRQELVGSLLEIDTPLAGVVIPVRVSADGLVSGEAGPLASTLGAAHDRGRWWINSDRLCVKWFRWFEAETRCITVEHEGTKIYWREEGGESGTARITKSSPEPAKVDPPILIEASRTSAPSTSPSPSSEATLTTMSVSTPPTDSVEPMRFAAVDLVGGLLPASTVEPEPNKLGVGTSDPPKTVTPLPVAEKDQTPLPPQGAMKISKPTVTPMPSFRVTRVAVDDALIIRSGPSEYHPPVGVIPPDGKGVLIVGVCRDLWCPVRHRRSIGWVNRYYLADDRISSSPESSVTARDR
jgi:uncharacterized protein YraI